MPDRFEHKRAFPVVEFKALKGKGEFSALVSVFGNVDYGGDRVIPGAFGKSLAQWQEKGDPFPIIWNHMWDNPEAHIGEADPGDLVETNDGLLIERAKVDMDRPFAEQVFHLLERRRVKEFSFGYNIPPGGSEFKDGANNLTTIDIFEAGPTLKGMNPATELLAVKALAAATAPEAFEQVAEFADAVQTLTKAGARHSKETLAALTRMRAELDALIGDGEKAVDEPPAPDDAKALDGTASDPDADITHAIALIKGQLP